METFSALLAICAGKSPVPGEFPTQRPVTRSFEVFYLRPNKLLSKRSWGWWFETLSWSWWRHCNGKFITRWRLKSPASRWFAQTFVQAQVKKTSKLGVTGLCEGNLSVTGAFPSQRASNTENISIWWRHHVFLFSIVYVTGSYASQTSCWFHFLIHLDLMRHAIVSELCHHWFR